jgi:hypothetical protein
MLGKGLPNAGIVYRDVAVMSLRREENGNMRLWGIHGNRDYLDILYEDVLYSQLDETNAGLRVSLVEELTLDEMSELRHNTARNRMIREVPERFSEFIDGLSRNEYRIYAHYTVKVREPSRPRTKDIPEERLVIARRVRVEGPDERFARKKIENREYKFYAFVSHAEGGEDEKSARWIQRRLENFRIPVDAVLRLRREEDAVQSSVAYPGIPEPIPERLRVAHAGAEAGSGEEAPSKLARYLIVVCSPCGAKSERVERDTKDFLNGGKEDYVIPFIVVGEPIGSEENRCYPPSLSADVLGVSLSDGSREEAFIRVMARLLRVKFSRFYQRHLREKRRFLARALMAALAVLVVLSGLTAWAVSSEIKAARRQEEADGIARFLVEELRDDPRIPEEVRAMIGKKVLEYREKRNG